MGIMNDQNGNPNKKPAIHIEYDADQGGGIFGWTYDQEIPLDKAIATLGLIQSFLLDNWKMAIANAQQQRPGILRAQGPLP